MTGTCSSRPLVAVVLSVYNKAPFVGETIASVLAQTYAPIELIVIDDGSTDESLAVIRGAVGDADATIVTLINGGVSRARNVGFEHASDDAAYVLFLDADDLLVPGAIAALVDHLEHHPAAVACYCDLVFVDEHGVALADSPDQLRWVPTRFGRRTIDPADHHTPLDAVWSRFWALPSALLIRRDAFERSGGWDSDLCRPARPFHAEDKDMAIRLAMLGDLHHLDGSLVHYRVLPSGHKDAMYAGLKALDAKWWGAALSRADHQRVRRAIWFDARVQLFDAVAAARSSTHGAATRAVGLARAAARYATTGVRMRQRAR